MTIDDFIVTPKEDKSVTISIRMDRNMQDQLDELALQSKRSRNEIINLALEYALKNLKFVNNAKEKNKGNPNGMYLI